MPGRDHRGDFGDAHASGKVTITTAGGHTVVLDDAARTVRITHSDGCSVTLTASDVEVRANALVKVAASTVVVDAAMTRFGGVVQCDTLIANAVVSSSYTPGAGNVS
jgi:hypothetical protein